MRHIFPLKFLHLFIITGIISISSLSQAASVSFSWTPNTEANLAGYIIYSGTSSGHYSTYKDVGLPEIIEGNVSSILTGIAEGVTYYFTATAYDSDGFESGFSQEILYYIPQTLTQRTPRGDFNGDGIADILFRNSETGFFWISELYDKIIKLTQGVTLGLKWNIASTEDFNGDGTTDILLRNSSTGEIWLYEMSGNNIINNTTVDIVGLNWAIASTEDFNGDGKADILLRNSNTGEIWLYEMNGNNIINNATVDIVACNWAIASTEDFNGDGKADILFRNSNTGEIWLYEMNGSNILGSNSFGTIPLTHPIILN